MIVGVVSAGQRAPTVLPRPRPIDGAPPVCDFRVTVRRDPGDGYVGASACTRTRVQRLEIADAILASGSDHEATWLAIMERVTGP